MFLAKSRGDLSNQRDDGRPIMVLRAHEGLLGDVSFRFIIEPVIDSLSVDSFLFARQALSA